MNCDYDLCIYWEAHKCVLSCIAVNYCGMCEEFIPITFDKDTMQKRREELLAFYEEEYQDD